MGRYIANKIAIHVSLYVERLVHICMEHLYHKLHVTLFCRLYMKKTHHPGLKFSIMYGLNLLGYFIFFF